MLFNFRRKEIPWEVVDNKAIEPVSMYYDEDKGARSHVGSLSDHQSDV
jgi:hypothetical protein